MDNEESNNKWLARTFVVSQIIFPAELIEIQLKELRRIDVLINDLSMAQSMDLRRMKAST